MIITNNNGKPPSVLFILGSFTLGGIQSNFVRLLPYLIEKNISVGIFLLTDKIEDAFIPYLKDVEFYFFKNYIPLPFFSIINSSAILHSLSLDNKKIHKRLSNFTHLHAVESESMVIGDKLASVLNIPLSVGCYHPREFTWSASHYYFRHIQKTLYKLLPIKNRVFFNDDVLLNTVLESQCSGTVIPLTIQDISPVYGDPISKKIVSIGRLVSFKTYNEHLIKSIDLINERFETNYEYHIYGDGPTRDYLEGLASQVTSKVVFHGNVPYSKFQEILEGSLLFVGVGSALLEAAATGVPCMYGIDSMEEPLTYGYFHEVPGTNLGEVDVSLNVTSYVDFFNSFLIDINLGKYKSLCNKEIEKASSHSLPNVSNLWLNLFLDSKMHHFSYSKFRYFFSNILWLTFNVLKLRSDRSSRY